MSGHFITSLVFRLLGLYIVIQVFPMLQSLGIVLSDEIMREDPFFLLNAVTMVVLPLLAQLAIGGALMRYSDDLAQRFMPQTPQDDQAAPAGPSTTKPGYIQAVLFSAIGLFVIATSLPAIVNQASLYLRFVSEAPEDRVDHLVDSTRWSTVGHVLKLLTGLLLFFASRRLSRWWHAKIWREAEGGDEAEGRKQT